MYAIFGPETGVENCNNIVNVFAPRRGKIIFFRGFLHRINKYDSKKSLEKCGAFVRQVITIFAMRPD